jgi:thiamine-phosphate pyrophosphorylase
MSKRHPRLLAITDRLSVADGNLLGWVEAVAAAGVEGLQIREKDLSDREVLALATRIRSLLPPPRVLLVNRRADIAVVAGADGVHLPSDGLPVSVLRRRYGQDFLLGRSTHHPEEVAQAQEAGADFVTFGPVYRTPSKERYGEPVGLLALERAVSSGIPVLALGGITAERLEEVAETGAAGCAGIRIFQDPGRLAEVVEKARALFSAEEEAEQDLRDP